MTILSAFINDRIPSDDPGAFVQCSVAAAVTPGLPSFGVTTINGPYLDYPIRESRDRIRAAIMATGLPWPAARITAVIDPAPRFVQSNLDLPIALAVLAAIEPERFGRFYGLGAVGTLNLDGRLMSSSELADVMMAEVSDAPVTLIPGTGEPLVYREDRMILPRATLADVVEFVQVDPSLANDPPIDEPVPA